jgi:hypothetical protein
MHTSTLNRDATLRIECDGVAKTLTHYDCARDEISLIAIKSAVPTKSRDWEIAGWQVLVLFA